MRKKLRIPLFIVIFFLILFVLLFYKHVKNVHQRRQMLTRFLAYEQFLQEVKFNVNDLRTKINESRNDIRELSETLSLLPQAITKDMHTT